MLAPRAASRRAYGRAIRMKSPKWGYFHGSPPMIQTARPPAAREGKLDKTRVTGATARTALAARRREARPSETQEDGAAAEVAGTNHNQDRGSRGIGRQERGSAPHRQRGTIVAIVQSGGSPNAKSGSLPRGQVHDTTTAHRPERARAKPA